jgi:hypothetical protein
VPLGDMAKEALDNCGEDGRKVAKCQTCLRRGHPFRGIAASERLIYEVILLCLVLTLTSLDELRKISGRSTHKRKDDQRALSLDRHEKLLIA